MQRNELKTIAGALRKVRPVQTSLCPIFGLQRFTPEWLQWRDTCASIADAMSLDTKARSIFMATSGLTTDDQVKAQG